MEQTISELATIRETIKKLLNELQLEAYLFEVEPKKNLWLLTLECAINGGWERVQLKANKDYLLHGSDDVVLHQLLIEEWRDVLSACKSKND